MGRIEELEKIIAQKVLLKKYGAELIRETIKQYDSGMGLQHIMTLNNLKDGQIKEILENFLTEKDKKTRERCIKKINIIKTELPNKTDNENKLTIQEAIMLVEGKLPKEKDGEEDEHEL